MLDFLEHLSQILHALGDFNQVCQPNAFERSAGTGGQLTINTKKNRFWYLLGYRLKVTTTIIDSACTFISGVCRPQGNTNEAHSLKEIQMKSLLVCRIYTHYSRLINNQRRQNSPFSFASLESVEGFASASSSSAPVKCSRRVETRYQQAKIRGTANTKARHAPSKYSVRWQTGPEDWLFRIYTSAVAFLPHLEYVHENVPSTSEMSSMTCLTSCSKRRSLDKHTSYSPFSTSNY